jgi:hypothetical protein
MFAAGGDDIKGQRPEILKDVMRHSYSLDCLMLLQ